MAFTIGDLKAMSESTPNGNRLWFYKTNDADATVEASGYFNNAAPDTLALGDLIIGFLDLDGTPEIKHYVVGQAQPNAVTVTVLPPMLSILDGLLIYGQTAQVLTGAGAVNITSAITHIVTTDADALTLADGTEGQRKFIVMKTDGGDGTLTPTNLGNGTTITFDDAGDSANLFFTNAAWYWMGGTATLA